MTVVLQVANRPDRAVRILAVVMSVAYVGFWVGAVLVLVAAPALKLWAPDDPDWEWGLPIPATVAKTEVTVLTTWGAARLEVEDVSGVLRLPIAMMPWWLFALLWTHFALAATLILTFLHHLRRVLQRARDGAPFDARNAPRLWWMGLTLIWFVLVNRLAETISSLALKRVLASDDIAVRPAFHVDMSMLFFALVLLALAVVFRRGTQLEDEQSLVV